MGLREEIAAACRCVTMPLTDPLQPLSKLRTAFWVSGLSLAAVVLVACLLLWARNKIGFDLALDIGKCCSVLGAYFAGWGTWLGLLIGTKDDTWKGDDDHEKARSGFFKLFFLIGVFFSTIGAAWWG